MKAIWVLTVLFSSCIKGQKTGEYLGIYNSNYYVPQLLVQPTHHPRLLPFGEDIVMDSVVEESAYFKIKSKTIKQWLRLSSDNQYLLGIGDREVTLVSLYKIKDNNYQAHEYPYAVPYEITSAAMFEIHTVSHGPYPNGFVLLALDSPKPTVMLYKIKNFKLVNIATWKREHRVQNVAHFKWLEEDRIVVVEETNNVSLVHVIGLEFDRHLPHYWHIETLTMNSIEGHPSIGSFQDGRVYMAVIQKKDSTVKVYAYKNVCYGDHHSLSGNKFEPVLILTPIVARKTVFFEVYQRKYLMTISLHTMLYTISPEDRLMEDTKFTLSADMIMLPLPTPGGGALLLGKSFDGNPYVYTLSSPDGEWKESPTPRCRRSEMHSINGTSLEVDLKECIGGSRSWTGATHIEAEGYPSLLFADRTFPGELYHFSYSIKVPPPSSPSTFDNNIEELESIWNSLRSNLLNRVLGRSPVDYSDSTPICTVQPEVIRMHKILSELRDRLALAHCSAFPMELALEEADHNIAVDEGKPQEVILQPSAKTFEKVGSPDGDSINEQNRGMSADPIVRLDDHDTKKTTVLSPELEDESWKRTFIDDPGMGELEDIYRN